MWEKLFNNKGLSDFAFVINGYVIFSITVVNKRSNFICDICLFNHRIYEKEYYNKKQ